MEMFRSAGAILIAVGFSAFACGARAQPEIDGRYIAQRNCSQCHAIGTRGDSRLKGAPAFRDLSYMGDIDDVVEALRNGLLMHEPAMPEIRLTPKEITALAAYLRDVQSKKSVRLSR